MEINYKGKLYFVHSEEDLTQNQIIDNAWFYVKNSSDKDIDDIARLRVSMKYLGCSYDDKKLEYKIDEMEKNKFRD